MHEPDLVTCALRRCRALARVPSRVLAVATRRSTQPRPPGPTPLRRADHQRPRRRRHRRAVVPRRRRHHRRPHRGDRPARRPRRRRRASTPSDLVVAPGFIDMLGQSEFNVLVDPRAASKITQGITTEITGEGIVDRAAQRRAGGRRRKPQLRPLQGHARLPHARRVLRAARDELDAGDQPRHVRRRRRRCATT